MCELPLSTSAVACPDREEKPTLSLDTTESVAVEQPADLPSAPDGEAAVAVEAEAPTDVTARLAEEFLLLAEEFPQFVSPGQLPDGVLELAVQQGIPLLDAYLRYRLQEEKKVAAAAEKRRQAAAQSAGSLSRGAAETPPEQDAFVRAFRAAI